MLFLPASAAEVVAVSIHVMAMRINPVAETIIPRSSEGMVRINVSPAVVVIMVVIPVT